MKPDAAKSQFLEWLAAGLSLDALTPATGVEAMPAYDEEERADGSVRISYLRGDGPV